MIKILLGFIYLAPLLAFTTQALLVDKQFSNSIFSFLIIIKLTSKQNDLVVVFDS